MRFVVAAPHRADWLPIWLEREFMTELEIQAPASAQPGKSLIDQDDEPPLPIPDSA
jgi:hypothetical protein